MKRSRHPSSSDESDNGSNSTCWSQHSSQPRRGTGQKPSEVFRTDLITAMKVHDSFQLNPEDYYVLADAWRQEWEKGVQVPVSPQSIPQPAARVLAEKGKEVMFVRPKKLIRTSGAEALGYVDIRTLAEGTCRYDLSEEDVAWLHIVNQEFTDMALPPLDELTMERVMEEFEHRCYENMTHAVETEEGLGIEYDEDVVCDVCRSPDGEDNNEMVFCDKCNICVHQACYGIQKVPKGSWLCRICALGILPKCQLCPKKGGAMKPTRSGTKWVHVSCALWIPEVSIGNPEKMEPITNVSHIPSNRWALICCLCKEKSGACIQCSAKNCRVAFHVTCGLHAGLEMNTILTAEDEVKFQSFCPKHSGLDGAESRDGDSVDEDEKEAAAATTASASSDRKGRRRGRVRGAEEDAAAAASPSPSSYSVATPPPPPPPPASLRAARPDDLASRQQEKRVSMRKLKLQQMEEEFFLFVQVEAVAAALRLPPPTVDFVFQYWKLKRKANFNLPLLTPRKDEEESLARREQEVLLRRLQLFTHLRQDLERVRNLTYMVTRREKMKRSLWRVQEQIFQQQVKVLDQELLTGDPSSKDLDALFSLGRLSPPASGSAPDSSAPPSSSSWTRESAPGGGRGPTKPDKGGAPPSHARIPDLPDLRDAIATKLHRPKGPRREEPDQRRRRSYEAEQRQRLGARGLEKTVSIRLVDIRSSDSDDYFLDEGKRGGAFSLDPKLKTNGVLRRQHAGHAHSSSSSSSSSSLSGHLRSWGKFRIPKRSERSAMTMEEEEVEEEEEEEAELHKPPLLRPPLDSTRLRSGTDSDGEAEPCLKRCHSHQLRGDASLSRRYGSDIIRRGVLAS